MSVSETKTCQNCKSSFIIDASDFDFYEKIQVPAPTLCPDCRYQRRIANRNEWNFYKRNCSLCGKDMVSIYNPSYPGPVYCGPCFWSDKWDPLSYGRDIDFSKPFFAQFRELLEAVPLEPLFNKNAVNSDYGNHNEDMKNCYLTFASIWNENVSYSRGAIKSKDSMDLYSVDKSELIYDSMACEGCYNISFSKHSYSCTNSAFLTDCRGCSNCFGCVNLRNKSYYIFNQPYTKEEYAEKIKEFDLGSFASLQKIKSEYAKLLKQYPYRYAHITNCANSTGDVLWNCKNCKWCFDLTDNVEDCKYTVHGGYHLKDVYASYGVGEGDLMYQAIDTGIGISKVISVVVARSGRNVSYAMSSYGSSNTFGCIGLRNKQYCILNRQHSKKEYEALLPKVIDHMNSMPYIDKKGIIYKYGEFFPSEIAPFAYNETIAQEYFPLNESEAKAKGCNWKDPESRNYTITKNPKDLPDHIKDVEEGITKEIIGCAHKGQCIDQCTTAFRIIPEELSFYRKMNLALPRLCPNCRHYERLRQRNPLKLWHRKCQCAGKQSANSTEQIAYTNTLAHSHGDSHCPNEFETSYAPDRPEIVYCENCYNSEVV